MMRSRKFEACGIRFPNPMRGTAGLMALLVGLGSAGAFAQDAIRTVAPTELTEFPRNDDSSTAAVPLGFNLNFFGQTRSETFVNNNGNITLDQQLGAYTPFDLTTTGREIIAPFFADVDTRRGGEPVRYGQTEIGGRQAFVVNFIDVDYFSSQADRTNLNSFQLVLIDRSDIADGDADIEFNYGTIVWETGSASGGDGDGLGGDSARVGWSNGSGEPGTFFELPGSAIPGALLDDGPSDTALVLNSRNSDTLGRFVFLVRGGGIDAFNLDLFIEGFRRLVNDTVVAQAEQQFALGQMMSRRGFTDAGQTVMSSRIGAQNSRGNSTDLGTRTTSLASLSFWHGINDTFTLGTTIGLSGARLRNNAFDMDTGFGAAIWGQYSEGGTARTGLQFGGALGYMRAKGDVTRGRSLPGVTPATGGSTVGTRAVEAALGYGFEQGDWLVTPSLGLAHYKTRRAAYTEQGTGFTASYDALRTSRTVATLDVTGEFAVSEQGNLSLGIGVDRDVSPERPRLTGTSDIPGLATFDVGSTFSPNRTRVFADMGYSHDFGNGSTLSGDLRVGRAVYGSSPSVGLGVSYTMRF